MDVRTNRLSRRKLPRGQFASGPQRAGLPSPPALELWQDQASPRGGVLQRSPGNRAKSPSKVTHSGPASMVMAAKKASGTKFQVALACPQRTGEYRPVAMAPDSRCLPPHRDPLANGIGANEKRPVRLLRDLTSPLESIRVRCHRFSARSHDSGSITTRDAGLRRTTENPASSPAPETTDLTSDLPGSVWTSIGTESGK